MTADRTRQTPACPKCGRSNSKVIDGRAVDDSIYRRSRECLECGHKFKHYEIPESMYDKLQKLRRIRYKLSVLFRIIDEIKRLVRWEAPTR